MSPSCPCCGGNARRLRELPRAGIVAALNRLMPQGGAETCTFGNYELWGCEACSLEFAEPMTEPDRDFYAWMTLAARCYPEDRWEWSAFLDRFAPQTRARGEPLLVVDVGCGSGRFLRRLRGLPGCRAVGLDVNLASVEACRAQGLEALHGDFASCLDQLGRQVDVVTLWHVVEHVADPVGLLQQTRTLLKPDGIIALSVPLSPVSYETTFPDPLNLPPHHLTRWRLESLQALAARLEMTLELALPTPEPFLIRMVRPLIFSAVSPFVDLRGPRRWLRLAAWLIAHPWAIFIAARDQLRCPRIDGKARPDVVLAILSAHR